MRQQYQSEETPKEAQNFRCFECGEPIYFKRGFFNPETGKAERFNYVNDQPHRCNPAEQAHYRRRRQKAYWARRNGNRQSHRETRRERENRQYNEAQDRKHEEPPKQEYKQREEEPKHRTTYSSTDMTYSRALYILKLQEGFTLKDLETAKRAGWMKYHPDRNHGAGAAELFRAVTDAYEYLRRYSN